VRELREKRDALIAGIEMIERKNSHDCNAGLEVEKAIKKIEMLCDRIADADPRLASEALQRTVERVDLWFEHDHQPHRTKSFPKRRTHISECC